MSAAHWTPDVVVDEALAWTLIDARFPDLRGLPLSRLGHGMDNAAYLVGDVAVFRFPQRTIAAPLIATEIAVLPMLAPRLPVAIPFPRWVGEPDATYPWRFAGYALLHGTPIDVARSSEDVRARLAPVLGRFLRVLHDTPPAPLRAAGLPPDVMHRMDAPMREPMTRERLASLVRDGVLDDAYAAAIFDVFHADAPLEPPACTVAVHGDLYARHLLVDDAGTLTGVIDWGDVHEGDPAVDLSVVHEIVPRAARDAFFAAYGDVDETTWRRARWRAIHHAVLVAHYGQAIGDTALADGGVAGLQQIVPP